MPSKKSKPTKTPIFRSSRARICSETELSAIAKELVEEAREDHARGRPFARVLLRGPMGAGKSAFARAFLHHLRVDRASEGSPTFAIAHAYRSSDGISVIHADGYRLDGDTELEATGLIEALWEPRHLVLFEWIDLFPKTEAALLRSDLPVTEVVLAFTPEGELLREVRIGRRIEKKR